MGHPCGTACLPGVGSWPLCQGQDSGEQSLVSYASQTNRVSWYHDTLRLDTPEGDNEEEEGRDQPLRFGVITHNVSHMVQGGVLPGRSILGLYACQPFRLCPTTPRLLDDSDDSFVSQLFGNQGSLRQHGAVVSLRFDANGAAGELRLGGLHPGVKGWVPLLTPRDDPALEHSPHCVLRLRRFAVVGADGRTLLELPITLARLDTGNTWMSLPSWVFRRHGPLGRLPGVAGVRLTLERRVALFLPAPLFSAPAHVARATGFGGLVEDRALERNMMVIGNSVMKGMIVAIDLARTRIGFGGPPASVGGDPPHPLPPPLTSLHMV